MIIPSPAKKCTKRVGRGCGTGNGKTSGKGHKGQRARSGKGKPRVGFEGGQTPIYRRLPKFGFNNPFSKTVQIVNLEQLEKIAADVNEITPDVLLQKRLIKPFKSSYEQVPVKVLGQGNITKSIHIKAHSFSASAKAKIEKAGGKAEVIALG